MNDDPDLVFFYSEPLVDERKEEDQQRLGKYVSTGGASLATDLEYRRLLDNLEKTYKTFNITKEALNFEMLKQAISAKPSIIHISCHGDYDPLEKEFYLQFEKSAACGVSEKYHTSRLKLILGEKSDH